VSITNSTASTATPLLIGEVLFDCFPDGSRILGGAPFNVAWHLQGLGAAPFFVSAVGQDDAGQAILSAMASWGMRTDGMQTVAAEPTGQVQVRPGPSYDILAEQAYDAIDPDRLVVEPAEFAMIYHGSLALRETASRERLLGWRQRLGLPVFVDINIRPPWFEFAWLPALIDGIFCLKLNDDELAALTGHQVPTVDTALALGDEFRQQHGISHIVVTCGQQGAAMASEFEQAWQPACKPAEFIDSVGAGDGFAAITLLGLLAGWSANTVLLRASEFAARICAQRGAIANNALLYQEITDAWSTH